MLNMKTVYEKINNFINNNPSIDHLIPFCEEMIDVHPSEKTFVQEWCLGIFISNFSGKIFSDKVLTSYSKVFVLDSKALGARMMIR